MYNPCVYSSRGVKFDRELGKNKLIYLKYVIVNHIVDHISVQLSAESKYVMFDSGCFTKIG